MSLARTPFGSLTSQIMNAEYDGDDNPVYLGFAAPGTLDSDPLWFIQKLTWVGGNCESIRFANSSSEYGAVWNDRASFVYG